MPKGVVPKKVIRSSLRIKDIDLERCRLCIRGAKGGNDRVVALPAVLIPELRQQMQFARTIWLRDNHNRMPVILLRNILNFSFAGAGPGYSPPITPAVTHAPELS